MLPDVYAEMPTDVAIKKIIVSNRKDEGSSQASLQEFVVPEKIKNVKGTCREFMLATVFSSP
jgi:hypothetical protein